jgi:Asp-tRNA(Asn)/Glu-tRNA(Gln) amidotransferase A subunit family amidase
VQAVSMMHATGRALGGWMVDYDVVLTPTMAITPPRLGILDPTGRRWSTCSRT